MTKRSVPEPNITQTLNRSSFHACVLAPRPGSAVQRPRRGSVRPEQPERTVTMSFSIGPTESQRQNRAPSSRPTATDPERRQLRPSAAGCPGEREGLWHRRTLFWRTSSGVQVVSPRAGESLGLGESGPTGLRLGPGLQEYSVFVSEVWWRMNARAHARMHTVHQCLR